MNINSCHMVCLFVYQFTDYKIQPIPLVDDNYAYLIIEKSSNTGILVDPSDALTVQVKYFKSLSWKVGL